MHIDSINRHLCSSEPLDWFSHTAAMKLAWYWTAQEMWADRAFDADPRPVCASKLKAAWDHVKAHRRYLRRQRSDDIRVRALLVEREQLHNKPWGVNIDDEQRRIDARIEEILDEVEAAA